jgi:hypothetical protein
MNEIEKQLLEDEKELAKALEDQNKENEEPSLKDKIQEVEAEPEKTEKVEPEENSGMDELKHEEDKQAEDNNLSPSAAAFAKERREKRELAAKLKELEEKLAKSSAQPTVIQQYVQKQANEPAQKNEKPIEDLEPNKTTNYEEWLEWRDRQVEKAAIEAKAGVEEIGKSLKEIKEWRESQQEKIRRDAIVDAAVSEFVEIEDAYKKENPDYANAVDFGRKEYGKAIRMRDWDKTPAQIEAELDHMMLMFASQAKSKGLNPAEEIYDLAIERFGYTPKTKQQEAEAEDNGQTEDLPPKKKTNLSKIQENKKRSISGLASGSGTSGTLTAADIDNMSNAEFSRLTPSQLRELEAAAASE